MKAKQKRFILFILSLFCYVVSCKVVGPAADIWVMIGVLGLIWTYHDAELSCHARGKVNKELMHDLQRCIDENTEMHKRIKGLAHAGHLSQAALASKHMIGSTPDNQRSFIMDEFLKTAKGKAYIPSAIQDSLSWTTDKEDKIEKEKV